MKSAGSSLNSNGDLTIYFTHKEKVAYAIIEPLVLEEEIEDSQKSNISLEPATLVITSKDKNEINSIVLKRGNKVEPKKLNAFYRIEIDDLHHPIELDTMGTTHRLWHTMEKQLGVKKVGTYNMHFYNVNMNASPDFLALDDLQDGYVGRNQNASQFFYSYYAHRNQQYEPLFSKTQNVIGYPDTYFYPWQTKEYLLIHEISTTHSHHFHPIAMTYNPQSVRALFSAP